MQSKEKPKPTPVANHEKRHVPLRLRREPFKTLMISRKQPILTKDVAAAIGLKRLGNGVKGNWIKLDLPGDQMDAPAYKVRMPENFSTTLFAPPVPLNQELIYYLYNTYNFMDDLTKYDMYRKYAHYVSVVPKRMKKFEQLIMTGMTSCVGMDVRRRWEKFRLTGKRKPQYSNFGRRMLNSPRSLMAKVEKFGHPLFGHLISIGKDEIIQNNKVVMSFLYDEFMKNPALFLNRIKKFIRRNREWIRDRMSCKRQPIFFEFPRNNLQTNVINLHRRMVYRSRGDQDLFSEFNVMPTHLAFTAHFCRVLKNFKVNRTKEDAVIRKAGVKQPLIRVRLTRYSHFPAVSIVNYNANDELQTTLLRIPRRAPSIADFSGYSSDSAASVASDTPLDWEFGWDKTDKELEHRMNTLGDTTRGTAWKASERHMNERRWREMIRRKKLLYREDRRFELQDTVPIFTELHKMHPPLLYCRLKGMELNKLRRSAFSSDSQGKKDLTKDATAYLVRKRIEFLEKTLPCRDDNRVLVSKGWKVFGTRENTDNFKNVARILKQRSSWVSKNCLSKSATVPRCDKLPMSAEGRYKKLFLVLIFLLTMCLGQATMALISYL